MQLRRPLKTTAAALLPLAAVHGAAVAQAVTPMSVSVGSYTDRYVVNLTVSNPYPDARRFQIAAYAPDGRPVPIWTPTPAFSLPPAGVRNVTVAGAVDGADKGKVFVCAETLIAEPGAQRMRGQVCSTLSVRRLAP